MASAGFRALGSLLVLTAIASSLARSEPQTTAPAPGVVTGQKIGNVIKTAITTAVPALSTLLDLIWSHSSKANSDSAKKTELQDSAKKPDTQVEANQKIIGPIQEKLQPIGQVADELAVIEQFLDPCVTATGYLIGMQTKAKEQTTDWQEIGNKWELAKAQLGRLKSVSASDLRKVRDKYLAFRLGQIQKANDTTVMAITQEVTQKNLPDLKTDLAILLATLADMTAISGYEFSELEADISDLAIWAKGDGAKGVVLPSNLDSQGLVF